MEKIIKTNRAALERNHRTDEFLQGCAMVSKYIRNHRKGCSGPNRLHLSIGSPLNVMLSTNYFFEIDNRTPLSGQFRYRSFDTSVWGFRPNIAPHGHLNHVSKPKGFIPTENR